MAGTTRKKVKYVGTETFINTTTGEIEEMQVTSISERDFNFTKVWLREFLYSLDLIGNKKTKVVDWILSNLDKENKIVFNYRQISDKTGISYRIVAITMKTLLDANFFVKVGTAYMVNPDYLWKGGKGERLRNLQIFQDANDEKKELSIDEKIENVEKSIEQLSKQLEDLKKLKYFKAV